MSDTAHSLGAAVDSEVLSTRDAIDAAAQAFKVSLGQSERPRGADGRFTSSGAPDEGADTGSRSGTGDEDHPESRSGTGIDALEAGDEPDIGAENQDDASGDEEAGDEPQPSDAPLPKSWPAEQAELWKSLPPETQAFIAAREGQRDAAVNAKFQEAANLRKAHEAEIIEAQSNRQRYAEAVDQVLSLVVPQPPPRSMLDVNSDDYDPDAYHYRKALHEDTIAFLNQHAGQRQQIAAQESSRQFDAINHATRDGFIQSVPDVADQAKAPAIFQGLMDYAVSLGLPAETFNAPTTAIEWHVLWKAKEYDRLQSAKARVAEAPKPEPRKAQPAVRPGVATPRAAIEQQQRGKAMDRLRKEGSVDAGAAAFKHLLKGKLS